MLVNGKTILHLRLPVCFSYTSCCPINYLICVRDYGNIEKIRTNKILAGVEVFLTRVLIHVTVGILNSI